MTSFCAHFGALKVFAVNLVTCINAILKDFLKQKHLATGYFYKALLHYHACRLYKNRAQEIALIAACNRDKAANMSIMNHHFSGMGFESLSNIDTVITIKGPVKIE